ncbi:hypothetical protein V6N13_098352 [Hibiscus sabdariffa]|uniref:Uncharacterized protein n=1 Tax=Hibiscus sabdariffa TaxID=183260 RepID=A0ABR2EDI4_9ROSI
MPQTPSQGNQAASSSGVGRATKKVRRREEDLPEEEVVVGQNNNDNQISFKDKLTGDSRKSTKTIRSTRHRRLQKNSLRWPMSSAWNNAISFSVCFKIFLGKLLFGFGFPVYREQCTRKFCYMKWEAWEKSRTTEPPRAPSISEVLGEEENENFGPWMLVEHRQKKKDNGMPSR